MLRSVQYIPTASELHISLVLVQEQSGKKQKLSSTLLKVLSFSNFIIKYFLMNRKKLICRKQCSIFLHKNVFRVSTGSGERSGRVILLENIRRNRGISFWRQKYFPLLDFSPFFKFVCLLEQKRYQTLINLKREQTECFELSM